MISQEKFYKQVRFDPKKKDKKLARNPFPNLKVEQRTAPCSNSFAMVPGKKELPPDAKQFPVGHNHKQGLELITPGTDLRWMGGRKT